MKPRRHVEPDGCQSAEMNTTEHVQHRHCSTYFDHPVNVIVHEAGRIATLPSNSSEY
jgi:hypothetical protein